MSLLLIPIAPLSRTKSRLQGCFSREQLESLTIAMLKDMGKKLMSVNCFDEKIVYSNDSLVLELAESLGLTSIKEELTTPHKSFDRVIDDLNQIVIREFNAQQTIFAFLDLILISEKHFNEICSLMKNHQLLVCPAIHSAGISILGRNPPDVVSSSCFKSSTTPSMASLLNEARSKGIARVMVYDSFQASFDVDIEQDLLLAYEYLKAFNFTGTETFKFLKTNLKGPQLRLNSTNNRDFTLIEK